MDPEASSPRDDFLFYMPIYTLFYPVGKEYCIDSLLVQRRGDSFAQKHRWKYHYLFSEIIKATFNVDARWVPLHSGTLAKVLGRVTANGIQGKAYLLIRQDLQEWGILRFHTHQKANTLREPVYRINDEVLSHGFVLSDLSAPVKANKPRQQYTGLSRQLQQSFQRVTIRDKEAVALARHAFQIQSPLPAKRSKDHRGIINRYVDTRVLSRWLARIECFRVGETYFRVSNKRRTGRVNSSFTSFPKLLRDTIGIDGKWLVDIDVSACQPLLLTKLVEEHFAQLGQEPGKDATEWQVLCERGQIYPFLYANLLARGIQLESMMVSGTDTVSPSCTPAFKVELFAQVVFSKERKTKVRRAFTELFPSVASTITAAKHPKHNQLAIRLQRMESDLMIRTVCARLYHRKHRDFLPLHDAIYCTADLVGMVATEIKKAFQEVGLNPTIKVDGTPIKP